MDAFQRLHSKWWIRTRFLDFPSSHLWSAEGALDSLRASARWYGLRDLPSCVCMYMLPRSVVSDSLRPLGLQPARLLCPWNFPGKNTGVCCHFLLQGIFLTQGSNPGLLHCRLIFTTESPRKPQCVFKIMFYAHLLI